MPAPPADRDALLARVAPERQKIFRLVRQILDDLDEAAPWDDLYYPPDSAEAFLGMTAGLLGVADGIPGRISELVQLLALAAPDDDTRETLEEAEFYFQGIHGMCTHDMSRLRGLLEPFANGPDARALQPSDRNFLCEVAADLKGKYSSALMGATASIVAEGNWSGVAVEPVLFAEKTEEFDRNRRLLDGLRRTLAAIRELRQQVGFPQLVERWRTGARVDPYALADLATFRGILGQLLKRNLRRALYSGDYHQIQHREAQLAVRIAELEAVHFHTWSIKAADAQAGSYPRLVQLASEIAAILDVDVLEELVGGRAVRDLRAAVTAERSGPRSRKLSDELEALVPLVATDDLRTFLELLLGSVMKRASIAAERAAEAAPPGPAVADMAAELGLAAPTAEAPVAAPSLDDTFAGFESFAAAATEVRPPVASHGGAATLDDTFAGFEDLDSLGPASTEVLPPIGDLGAQSAMPGAFAPAVPEPTPAPPRPPAPAPPAARPAEAPRPAPKAVPPPAPPSPPRPRPAAPPAAATAPPGPRPVPPPVAPERRREAAEMLHQVLAQLQSPENAGYSSYRLLQRLLERHAHIPPSMLQGAHPFVYEVLNNLVPQLETAAAAGAVPAEARRRLVECCLALTSESITPEQMNREVPANLARLQRLLEGLQAATAAQLR